MSISSTAAAVETLRARFRDRFGDDHGVALARAPGRVNLLGDHTDYNDGYVLPMTIDRAVYWALRPRGDRAVRVHSINFDADLEFDLGDPVDAPAGSWQSYVFGVIDELSRLELLDAGFDGVFFGDVPLGGGLSSSAALEVATAVALQQIFAYPLDAIAQVKLCQRVEHVYAGVECGIMDQFASRVGRRGHVLLLDCRSLEYADIPLPLDEVRVVIVDSTVERKLAGSKYNERRGECDAAVAHFRQFDPAITALRDVDDALFERHGHKLPDRILRRCRHVVGENRRVRQAGECLRAGRLEDFGTLMNASHASLRDDYEVSCRELDTLVEIGQGTPGVLGARMTGAGFGGCTVHLVRLDAVAALEERIRREYPARCGREAMLFVVGDNLEAGPVPAPGREP